MFIDQQFDRSLEDLNLLQMCHTIAKLKAGMIALFENQGRAKVQLAKYIFLTKRMVPLTQRQSTKEHKNDFVDFLNTCYLKTGPNGEQNDQFVLDEYIKLHTSFMLKDILGL